jgi:dihydroneopterin aldolase
LRTRWTVRVDELHTRLAFAPGDGPARVQPVSVSLVVNGLAPDAPDSRDECLDLERVCRWITDDWPASAPTPLLENRVNELLAALFESDRRVQDAWVGLYRTPSAAGARRFGVERQASRLQFQSKQVPRARG